MKCFLVEKDEAGAVRRGIAQLPRDRLPPGDILVQVEYSSLNYKDALAAQANPGVAPRLPHVPGIDAAGVVAESTSEQFSAGDNVLVTGYDLGGKHWGGWSEFIRVPAAWIVPLPESLTSLDAMTLGTAGFTAAQCVDSLKHHGIDDGADVIVTGATGGVGSLAVVLLAQLGYRVTAVTGKTGQHAWLRELGAAEIVGRDDVDDTSEKPLLSTRWSGAVDTVGGNTLATLLKSLSHRGCVAACGLVGGTDLHTTVYPFLLRGITLDGIDSAQCPRPSRERIWQLLANEWKLQRLAELRTVVPLENIEPQIQTILAGGATGRVVVEIET